MENSPGAPAGPPARARGLGPVNPLSIAVAVVLLAAGGAFGWNLKSAAPRATAAAAGTLDLQALDATALCADAGDGLLRDAVLRSDGPTSERLADYLPAESPIPGYERVRAGELDAAAGTEYLPGAVEGRVAAFAPAEDGGFEVYAYRFLTRPAAAQAVTAEIDERVCGSRARAFVAGAQPGTVVVRTDAGPLRAWWLTQDEVVVVVDYRGWGDPDADLANLAAIVRAATASA